MWHDCDPGHDDAVTLLTLLGREDVHLLGVSTTHGNAPLSATTRNARALLTLAHREDVPVYAGAAAPLVREPVYAPEIHGAGGLGGVALPDPQREVRASTRLWRSFANSAPSQGKSACWRRGR